MTCSQCQHSWQCFTRPFFYVPRLRILKVGVIVINPTNAPETSLCQIKRAARYGYHEATAEGWTSYAESLSMHGVTVSKFRVKMRRSRKGGALFFAGKTCVLFTKSACRGRDPDPINDAHVHEDCTAIDIARVAFNNDTRFYSTLTLKGRRVS